MKKVICLYRGNTIDDAEKQKRVCHIYAGLQEWTIVNEFSEYGRDGSGKTDSLEIIHDNTLNREFDIILVHEYNDLGRDRQETPLAASWFISHGVDVVSVKFEKRDFEDEKNRILKQISMMT